jgi:hypothetical protein
MPEDFSFHAYETYQHAKLHNVAFFEVDGQGAYEIVVANTATLAICAVCKKEFISYKSKDPISAVREVISHYDKEHR